MNDQQKQLKIQTEKGKTFKWHNYFMNLIDNYY
jgi:hypothetical protein